MKKLTILLILSLVFTACIQETYKSISVDEAYELIQRNKNNSNFVIIDIRTLDEFKNGHIEGAINIDYYSPNFKEELKKLDKNKTYLIYCRIGFRSSLAMNVFKELGFKEVYNMIGGFTAWKNKGYPVVTD